MFLSHGFSLTTVALAYLLGLGAPVLAYGLGCARKGERYAGKAAWFFGGYYILYFCLSAWPEAMCVMLALGPFTGLGLLLGALSTGSPRTHRSRFPPGHCEFCGYDLRATPDRCPE